VGILFFKHILWKFTNFFHNYVVELVWVNFEIATIQGSKFSVVDSDGGLVYRRCPHFFPSSGRRNTKLHQRAAPVPPPPPPLHPSSYPKREIAQTTYVCCFSCTKHSLFLSFARNTNFTCYLLHKGRNLALGCLIINTIARAHSHGDVAFTIKILQL
jgi:hypothetical protein